MAATITKPVLKPTITRPIGPAPISRPRPYLAYSAESSAIKEWIAIKAGADEERFAFDPSDRRDRMAADGWRTRLQAQGYWVLAK